jgi:hypothetical protein
MLAQVSPKKKIFLPGKQKDSLPQEKVIIGSVKIADLIRILKILSSLVSFQIADFQNCLSEIISPRRLAGVSP